jgi:hypothetical protein
VVNPHDIAGSKIPEGSGTSASTPEARKRVVEDDATSREEAKWAVVEERPGVPHLPSPLELCEDESGQRPGPEVRPMMMNVTEMPRELQNAAPQESAGFASGLSHAIGHGFLSPPGVRRFRMLGPPPIGRASR